MRSVNHDHLLICGLGSIGRRHLRHFRDLKVQRIDAYRTGKATLPDDNLLQPDQVFGDIDRALAERPAMVVVANPTALHIPTALKAVRAGCHVLVEKPLGHSLEGCRALASEARTRGVIVSVACNLRFHPCLVMLRRWVQTREPMGEPVMARAHFGSYLPDWHPWEDYRVSYAARRDLGGGAALTHIHEIDYMLWLLGPAQRTCGYSLRKNLLGTNVDEAAAIVIRHETGVLSSLTLSLIERPPSRTLELTFTKGIVNLDLTTGHWVARYSGGATFEGGPPEGFDFDNTYRDQAAAFLQAVVGQSPPSVAVNEAVAALKIALQAAESGE
jgi:predicted dehydrogenase